MDVKLKIPQDRCSATSYLQVGAGERSEGGKKRPTTEESDKSKELKLSFIIFLKKVFYNNGSEYYHNVQGQGSALGYDCRLLSYIYIYI